MIVEFKNYLKLFENSSNDNTKLIFYHVYVVSPTSDNVEEYYGLDYDKAYEIFTSYDEDTIDRRYVDDYSEPMIVLEEIVKEYNFVYELGEDESIIDYDIRDYYDDSVYYKEIDEEKNILGSLDFRSINEIKDDENDKLEEDFNDIRFDVIKYLKDTYDKYIQYKEIAGYNRNSLYFIFLIDKNTNKLITNNENNLYNVELKDMKYDHILDDGSVINREYINRIVKYDDGKYTPIQIRISNHSQNLSNINDDISKSVSIVINIDNKIKKDVDTNNKNHKEYVYTAEDFDNDEYYKDTQLSYGIFEECTEIIDDFINEIE